MMHDLDALAEQVAAWRRAGDRIVFTNGCFDLLHAGHRHVLREAAGQGERLVVAVNSDASVRRLKGPGRPIYPEEHRAGLVADLFYVDAATIFEADSPRELIERLRPDVLVKGDEYRGRPIAGADFVVRNGGTIYYVPRVAGLSTSRTIVECAHAVS